MYDIVYHVIAHFFLLFSPSCLQSHLITLKNRKFILVYNGTLQSYLFLATHTHSVCTRLGRPFSGQIDCGIVYCQGEQDPRKFSCIVLVYRVCVRVCTHQIF